MVTLIALVALAQLPEMPQKEWKIEMASVEAQAEATPSKRCCGDCCACNPCKCGSPKKAAGPEIPPTAEIEELDPVDLPVKMLDHAPPEPRRPDLKKRFESESFQATIDRLIREREAEKEADRRAKEAKQRSASQPRVQSTPQSPPLHIYLQQPQARLAPLRQPQYLSGIRYGAMPQAVCTTTA